MHRPSQSDSDLERRSRSEPANPFHLWMVSLVDDLPFGSTNKRAVVDDTDLLLLPLALQVEILNRSHGDQFRKRGILC